MTAEQIVTHLDHFQRRVAQEALADATAGYWTRRAATFEWARPRPGDFTGQATQADLDALDRRCREAAEACRAKARVALIPDDRPESGVAA